MQHWINVAKSLSSATKDDSMVMASGLLMPA